MQSLLDCRVIVWRGLTASISMARSTPMTDAAQPMPDRLKVRMLLLNLKWFTTAADRDGVGLKAEQFTIKPSICTTARQTSTTLPHNLKFRSWTLRLAILLFPGGGVCLMAPQLQLLD